MADYHRKRDFTRTPEPAGGVPAADPDRPRFVVQRHRATRLHYDLRFEIDGVLVSWAVPKGPTLDPDAKRMAVHVEDHPIEYLDFEGVIPSGEYGGGDVIVWDIGTWEPHATDDPAAAVAAGDFHADLYGSKLQGRLILVRRGEAGDREQWLLLHKHDDHAVAGWDPEAHPRSVLSGRTNDEVQRDPDRLWRSDLPAARATISVRTPDPTDDELAALNDIGPNGTWRIFGHDLRVANLDRVMFAARNGENPVTKRELVSYAARIAPTVGAYVADRPLLLHRFPQGADENGSWQRKLPAHTPDWLPRWQDQRTDQPTTYLVGDDPAALVWAANAGALEWHAWTSLAGAPDQPTHALIEIVPEHDDAWEDVRSLALLHRTALEHLGVTGFPKLAGGSSIEIWVPVDPGPGFDEVRDWVRRLADTIEHVQAGLEARVEHTANGPDRTVPVPYSPLALAGAPVSAPVTWNELDDAPARPDAFTVRSVFDRLAERGDPFLPMLSTHQSLPDFR
ncbi:non-homologous end-joining DNA ligase LigD [Solicola gregarius]|uniref:ATP-dependent DNA ligase n=1 Tax=Solicola gregarius TaxID=2908642 RepID=A0AA46TMA6_9ACTN|nr:DNA polymerase ligase N-terminal domain-containing protein [Solicola gregarius]UYM07927.1 ATP-dependent DNA ligase [Solicola gregarius]